MGRPFEEVSLNNTSWRERMDIEPDLLAHGGCVPIFISFFWRKESFATFSGAVISTANTHFLNLRSSNYTATQI